MLHFFFLSGRFVFFVKNGLMVDYFFKKFLNLFYINFFFWTVFLFCEKYVVEFFFKNIFNISFSSNNLHNTNHLTILNHIFKTIATLFVIFF